MISLDELDYEDYVEVANVLVKELQDENCDIIIALTHMREPNDIRLGTISSWRMLHAISILYDS